MKLRTLSLLAIVMLVLGPIPVRSEAAAPRPDFLLVMADDMGWTDIGSFGSEIDTPKLDTLAQRGMLFGGASYWSDMLGMMAVQEETP